MMNAKALGIIFPNMHDGNIPEIIHHRTMASVPFAGRYRMIDFCLSGMAQAGMTNVGVVVRQNYQSLMDHLGSGREWDLSRKRGGMVIFPPRGRDTGEYTRGRIEALSMALDYLLYCKENYVVMSDCDIACNLDFRKVINDHIESKADITCAYEKAEIPDGMQKDNVTFTLDEAGFVTGIRNNDYRKGTQNLSMNLYVMGREFLIALIKDAVVRSESLFEREVLPRGLPGLRMRGFEVTGYRARIYDMRSYFEENLRLLRRGNLEALFPEAYPICTKVRDEAPVRYAIGAIVKESIVADGCIIKGEIENCVLFRGVRVGQGAKLKNCVIMQGGEIGPGASLENVVTDKDVWIAGGQYLRGSKSLQVFIPKRMRVE